MGSIAGSYESILYKKKTDSILKKMEGELDALDPPLEEQSLHVLISKKSTLFGRETIELIDKNIAAMKKDGTFRNILAKHGMLTK